MTEEQRKEYVKQAIESEYTQGWYLLGKLEWTDPGYGEVTGMPEQDLLWVMSVDNDTYETPEGAEWETPGYRNSRTISTHRYTNKVANTRNNINVCHSTSIMLPVHKRNVR